MKYTRHFILSYGITLLASCGADQSAPTTINTPDSTALGLAVVQFNGRTHELDVWKLPCGEILSGEAFRISAGIFNPDNPNESAIHLNLGGTTQSDGSFEVLYVPTFNPWTEINVRKKAEGIPWMNGKTFRWSGETLKGKPISIEAECP